MFQKKNTIQSVKFANKRKKESRRNLMMKTFLALTFFGFMIYFARADFMQVQGVVVQGNLIVLTDEINKKVNHIIDEEYLKIFPRKNIVLSPTSSIEKQLTADFPTILDAKVKKSLDRHIYIDISERVPAYTWCDASSISVATTSTTISAGLGEECYYADDKGFIFGQTPKFGDKVYIKLYGGDFDGDPIRHYYIDDKVFVKVSAFIKTISSIIKDQPRKLTYKNNDQFELAFDSGLHLLFSSAQNLDDATNTLRIFVNKNKTVGVNVKYSMIDLRFTNKVYYKVR